MEDLPTRSKELKKTVKQNKDDRSLLMEQAHELLNAVISVHISSDTGAELPPSVLNQIGKFTETLHKIHTFVEAQQKASKVKSFFCHGEMSGLLKECKAGLQQGLDFFQIKTLDLMKDVIKMQEDANNRHKEVLDLIETLSNTCSDGASSIIRIYSGSHNSSNSISMLPPEPKIFHGRQSEISEILQHFKQGTPRIAILGAGGMGKTSLARAIVHHGETAGRYEQHRFFVACDSAATQVELAAFIGAHLGLKPGKDLTRPVIQHFSTSPQSLLILDNLETLWEPTESRANIEEFLSLLTGIDHLALVPLKPLEYDAAQQTFIDIADNTHNPEEVNQVLALTGNMPLAINILAHLVDSEGCTSVLSCWEEEKTSLMSDGYDRRSNLDLSISLSLSSPRLDTFPHSKYLLSLLSMLPDGLSDAELVQAKLSINNILGCKAALIRTTLAYSDEHKQLKALVPIREYMQKIEPPGNHLVRPLLKHSKELLELFMEYHGTHASSATVARIASNYSNIQNILWNGAQPGHPDLADTIYCAWDLNFFSRLIGLELISFTGQIHQILPQPRHHHLKAYYIISLFNSFGYSSIPVTETLVSEALEHFKHFDDADLKYMLSDCWYTVTHMNSSRQIL
ncbi:P-loop containing nucleoside triphosphate hydrolase protein [Mycena leptocephala]|nr:P-loop containing nucleoside triphosphate hydrolase protein [Mycena leptocephala]